jgi:hypothetical protein
MKKIVWTLILVMMVAGWGYAAEKKAAADDTVNLLFVQDAQGVEFDKTTMTLKDAKPQVLYFSDRPHRIAGHMSRQEAMTTVKETFEKTPPNAVLVIFGKERSTDIVMTLTEAPRVEGENLVFPGIKIIQGTPPKTGGANALFIDTVDARRPGNPRGPADPRGPLDPR